MPRQSKKKIPGTFKEEFSKEFETLVKAHNYNTDKVDYFTSTDGKKLVDEARKRTAKRLGYAQEQTFVDPMKKLAKPIRYGR